MNNITIEYLFQLLLRRIWIVLVSAILCAVITFTYCNWFATEVYSASSKVIIGNGAFNFGEEDEENVDLNSNISSITTIASASKISGSDIQSSMYLANTCKELLQAQPIYEQLAVAMGAEKDDYNAFMRSITVDLASEDSIFITITAKSTSPEMAVKMANTFASIAPKYLNEYIPLADVGVTDTANRALLTSPRTFLTTALLAVAGAVVSYLISLIFDMNDKTIKGETDFTQAYTIPILGTVPDFDNPTSMNTGGYGNATQK
ncbi:MAG: hypothetical protein J6S00_03930 [Clostridia bacterium]|nr:hypothetical protein [Clostridia bacterium]